MSGVKSPLCYGCSGALLFAWAALAGGCANTDFARFAPPGIVKYEDLAGDQPQNPNVAARIAERRGEPGTGKFPNLSQTPGPDKRPTPLSKSQIASQTAELEAARETLAEDVAEDRAAAEAETGADLAAESGALQDRVNADSAAAARERREKLTPRSPADKKDD